MALVWLLPAPARAQFGARVAPRPAIGEAFHVELLAGFWRPTPVIVVSSESLGIQGTDIDFVTDLGIEEKRFRELRLVLRPAKKHKFRLQYVPIEYTASPVLQRDIVFNGIRYRVGLPVDASLTWKAWRLGYEYDFVSRDRWFIGFIVEAKYTEVEVELESLIATEFARARAPIPSLGGIGRVYFLRAAALTFELTGFKLPEGLEEDTRARYLDLDVYGTFNFSNNFGVQIGYRSLDVMYLVEADEGNLKMKGMYFAGVARF